mgnify:CR=1 FL=1
MDVWTECYRRDISIHALCEEGDGNIASTASRTGYFYPRPLRGGRLQSSPVRRRGCLISIHALCEEGDASDRAVQCQQKEFLSTPSARRATQAR